MSKKTPQVRLKSIPVPDIPQDISDTYFRCTLALFTSGRDNILSNKRNNCSKQPGHDHGDNKDFGPFYSRVLVRYDQGSAFHRRSAELNVVVGRVALTFVGDR